MGSFPALLLCTTLLDQAAPNINARTTPVTEPSPLTDDCLSDLGDYHSR